MVPHRPALLVVGHGAGGDRGRAALTACAQQVAAVPGVRDVFAVVGAAFLEGAEPSVPQAARLFLEGGCGEVVVAPLLLPVSPEVDEDLPGLVGRPVPEHVRRRLVAQGHDVLPPGLPVRLLGSLDVGALVLDSVFERAAARGLVMEREGIILCGEGSALHHERWEALMARLAGALRQRGIAYVGHAYVGATVGRSPDAAAEAIETATQAPGVERVHLVSVLMEPEEGLLRTMSAAVARARGAKPGRVVYEEGAVLPDPALARRVAHAALVARGIFPAGGQEGLA